MCGRSWAARPRPVAASWSACWTPASGPRAPPSPVTPLKTAPSGKFVPYRSGKNVIMTKSDGGTFAGVCQTGVQFTRSDCSTKIVGARYFGEAWLAESPPPAEPRRLRLAAGRRWPWLPHGLHRGRQPGVQAVVDGRDFGRISGVAPAAKIAVYKVLWQPRRRTSRDGDVHRHPRGNRGGGRRRRRRDQLLDRRQRRHRSTRSIAFLTAAVGRHLRLDLGRQLRPGRLDPGTTPPLGHHGRPPARSSPARAPSPRQRREVRRHLAPR